jgi:hypothetical protein
MMAAPGNVLKRTFLFEFNNWDEWDPTELASCISAAKTAGVRTVGVSRSSPVTATVKNQLDIFNAGFDVVYTYNLTNAVEARQITNKKNNITPP